MKQELFWVSESRKVDIGQTVPKKIRVWTLYHHTDPNVKPELPIEPKHLQNAALEDHIHDWSLRPDGILRYYSRYVESNVWILIETKE